jgi:hypothetical protein
LLFLQKYLNLDSDIAQQLEINRYQVNKDKQLHVLFTPVATTRATLMYLKLGVYHAS